MVVYGGFVKGSRTSDIYRYYFKENKWELVQPVGGVSPPKRAGHSAILFGDSMIIFGGKDEDNTKLNDLWEFNFASDQWEQIDVEYAPLPRSGHSASLYKDFMLIYGGIHEVTKELDDMHVFDFKNKRWIEMFEEQISPLKRKSPAISKNPQLYIFEILGPI